MPCVPSQTQCEAIRVSSPWSTRTTCARGGMRSVMPEQLLDGEGVAERVRRRSEIVHPLDDRLRLRPKEAFGALLDSGVEIADLRIGLDDVLAIDLEYDLQNAVRRRVLRAHREHHRVAGLADDVGHGHHGRAHEDCPSVSTALPARARFTCSCNASSVRPEGGVPATTFVLFAKAGRGARSRAGPRIG